MNTTKVIIFSAAMAFLAFRLYQKYIKKGKDKPGAGTNHFSGSSFSSSSKDDDYEPYSKK
ncbi:MAG: hypothetical protein NTX93_03005 [Bacteroidia bacterium]|nr:hypothetical protein [Bacteroidia bacterium]